MEALVLMYHQIVPDKAPEGWVPSDLADPRYGVTVWEFARQMAYLLEEEYTVLSLESLLDPGHKKKEGSDSKKPAIVITFDDGYESDLELAAPVLSHLGLPATFFVATGHLGTSGMLSETMVAKLANRPIFRIGGHGQTHRFLSELSTSECQEELFRSYDTIRHLTGQEEVEMSAPGGRVNAHVEELAKKAGFRALANSKPGIFSDPHKLFSIPRLPIMHHHSLDEFSSLLDPGSLAFQKDRLVRTAKQKVRLLLTGLSTKKGRG
jgi:peptidoglycan/xylan/chitin deacetylase (PgdA/CDA1 family)